MLNNTEKKKKLKEKKKYVGILVSEATRKKWKNFATENNFSTTSNLVRKAVNLYIDLKQKIPYLEDFSKISHELKRPLTSIKGFAQLLIDDYKDELSWDALLKIKEINDNSLILEHKIKDLFEGFPIDKKQYDMLIVEDDESTITLLLNFFESKGYKCKEAFLGNEAIEFLDKNLPKLILLDILLPDINGFEICKIIKSNKKLKDIPVYYITAVTEVEVNKKLKETGADGYFLKPFNFEEFKILFDYL